MTYHIHDVKVLRYPVLVVTFTDGYSGQYDLSDCINDGPMFALLKDQEYFAHVAVGEHGRSFGWNLDDIGHEIDFCSDSTRIHIETRAVEARAASFRAHRLAAE